jgi:hypothetical protein
LNEEDMSNKFDAKAYLDRWEPIIIPAMLFLIVLSVVLVVLLNVKTRPDCLRHEQIFCGTESQGDYGSGHHGAGHGTGHGDAGHGAEAGHGAHP